MVTEIYRSIQGESSFAGIPCTFIRLTGCPLRCRWCDTVYSFKGGRSLSVDEVLTEVAALKIPLVELTGGEPLAQEGARPLVNALINAGYQVLIETSGSEPIEGVNPSAHIIMDLKCPGSKMESRNRWENLVHLKPTDEVKFVIADRSDYEWAREVIERTALSQKCQILWSTAFGLLAPKDLVAWVLEDLMPGRVQLQMHKYIWSPRTKGV